MKTTILLLALIGSCLIVVNSLEFTLKRNGRRVAPNSVLNINTEIGRQYTTRSSWYYSSRIRYTNNGPLVCRTEEPHCCRDRDDPIDNEERGEWFYPNGQVVGSSQLSGNFYVTRERQELHLHSYSAQGPTGVYCCDVQAANNSGNITAENAKYMESACVGLYTSYQLRLCDDFTVSNGMVEYDSPYIPGRVANISCISGYALIGSSERICTNSGWNGTTPRCVYDCGPLSNPTNGQVDTPQGTTAGSTATYSCNEGYRLSGSSTRYCRHVYYSRYYRNNNGWSLSAPICVDEAQMQIRFSPTPGSCLEWDTRKADTMRQAFVSTIEKVIADHISLVLPEVSSENFTHSLLVRGKNFFSCRNSETDAHFRATINGLENVSAHDLVKAVQLWASTGPSIRIQWYVVDIDRSCPVAISSDVAPECVDSTMKQCLEQCSVRETAKATYYE